MQEKLFSYLKKINARETLKYNALLLCLRILIQKDFPLHPFKNFWYFDIKKHPSFHHITEWYKNLNVFYVSYYAKLITLLISFIRQGNPSVICLANASSPDWEQKTVIAKIWYNAKVCDDIIVSDIW